MWRIATAAVLSFLTFGGASGQERAAAAKPWPGWDTYQTVLWSTGTPSAPDGWTDRVREAGFTAIPIDPGAQRPTGLGYYIENLLPELGFHHGRKALYAADWNGYLATHDKRYLIRKPCFDDPAFWESITPRLTAEAQRNTGGKPLLYDLRDEASIGSFVSPMDYCFCPHTLRAFREWLKTRYATLAALNAEWETNFARWDDVVPFTTFEIKDRERAQLTAGRPENYAPWADHRAYMDFSFAKALDRMRSIVRRSDPETPVGIEGAQMPSAWGGYDLWLLSRAVDWIEPYDLANSRAILGSFLPSNAPVLSTYFDADTRVLRRTAWARLLDGDRGAVVWDDDPQRVILKAAQGMPLTARGKDVRDIFAEIRGAAAKLAGLRRVDDRIAIHYSQASIRAQWMFDSREDGSKWLRRLTSYEQEHSRVAQVRDSFVKVVEDLGLTADFVSYEEIENGELTRKRYKALLLPQSVALSAAECRNIEAFARAGGVVIADNMTATMDEHGRRLPAGQLDRLFGVRQTGGWKAAGNGGVAVSRISGAQPLVTFDSRLEIEGGARRGILPEAPMVVRNGSAFYLNIDMHPYRELRASWPRGANFVALFEAVFAAAGIETPVKAPRGHEIQIRRFEGRGVELISLRRNPGTEQPGSAAGAFRIHVMLPRRARVTAGARDLGVTQELDVDLDPWTPTLLELRAPR